MQGLPTARVLRLFGALVLACSANSAHAQIDPGQFTVRSASAQHLVSANQLLTPKKAQKAIVQAREAILQGRFEEADKQVKRALDIFPHCARALTFEGILKIHDGNDPEAVRLFQEAIDADPTLGVAYLALGQILNKQGRFKEALFTLDRAAAFLPGVWSVYFETARARLGVGEVQSGLTEIAYAERFVGGDAEKISALSLLRGVAHVQLKDFASAKGYLNEAIERDPKGPYAMLAQNALEQIRPFLGNAK
jgi:tetratricopeptide (TPR) repeat protein